MFFCNVTVPPIKGMGYHDGEIVLLEVPLNKIYWPKARRVLLYTVVAAIFPHNRAEIALVLTVT